MFLRVVEEVACEAGKAAPHARLPGSGSRVLQSGRGRRLLGVLDAPSTACKPADGGLWDVLQEASQQAGAHWT